MIWYCKGTSNYLSILLITDTLLEIIQFANLSKHRYITSSGFESSLTAELFSVFRLPKTSGS